jgi:hypothetical protein
MEAIVAPPIELDMAPPVPEPATATGGPEFNPLLELQAATAATTTRVRTARQDQ